MKESGHLTSLTTILHFERQTWRWYISWSTQCYSMFRPRSVLMSDFLQSSASVQALISYWLINMFEVYPALHIEYQCLQFLLFFADSKSYDCEICLKSFSRIESLRSHMKCVHESKWLLLSSFSYILTLSMLCVRIRDKVLLLLFQLLPMARQIFSSLDNIWTQEKAK